MYSRRWFCWGISRRCCDLFESTLHLRASSATGCSRRRNCCRRRCPWPTLSSPHVPGANLAALTRCTPTRASTIAKKANNFTRQRSFLYPFQLRFVLSKRVILFSRKLAFLLVIHPSFLFFPPLTQIYVVHALRKTSTKQRRMKQAAIRAAKVSLDKGICKRQMHA